MVTCACQMKPEKSSAGRYTGPSGAPNGVVGVGRVLEVHEVALEVAVQLPAAAELEGGVELLVALEAGLKPNCS